ncbi:hypothetical protein AVEN_81577-1 [Araneus ventricosus]|uniref:Uncharacterized protein n=1 Tax=Araneus ventricosus TaxID=182803 RepID=A0A4Y2FNH6_ARAVE|nr:hypothetical protein AVEN_81577-1 [Araneus ventricosus]
MLFLAFFTRWHETAVENAKFPISILCNSNGSLGALPPSRIKPRLPGVGLPIKIEVVRALSALDCLKRSREKISGFFEVSDPAMASPKMWKDVIEDYEVSWEACSSSSIGADTSLSV